MPVGGAVTCCWIGLGTGGAMVLTAGARTGGAMVFRGCTLVTGAKGCACVVLRAGGGGGTGRARCACRAVTYRCRLVAMWLFSCYCFDSLCKSSGLGGQGIFRLIHVHFDSFSNHLVHERTVIISYAGPV